MIFRDFLWMNDTFFLMANWKWVGLVIAAVCGFLIKALATQSFLHIKSSQLLQKRLHPLLKSYLTKDIEKPLGWVVVYFFWSVSLDVLVLPTSLEKYVGGINYLVLAFALLRLTYRGVDAFGAWIEASVRLQHSSGLHEQLTPFMTRTLKVLVVILGFLFLLQNFGVNVMSLLAGLGLGGLALALAAQDTAANLFGSITILLDRPFKVGDYVKVTDTEGTVEEVGFRSTRIRTFYQSVVTIPNSVMAKEKIDNMGARPMRRFRHEIDVTYETSHERLRQFTERIRLLLTQHPHIDKTSVMVRLTRMASSSVVVLVNAFIVTYDTEIEFATQEELLYEIMKIARELDVGFAYPTQTLYIPQISAK